MEALLVGMVDSQVLDRVELQRLAQRIAAAQKTESQKPGLRKRRKGDE